MTREILRREILANCRIDVLATDVLNYQLRPFHPAMLAFQSAAPGACLQLAPRGFGTSTVLTVVRSFRGGAPCAPMGSSTEQAGKPILNRNDSNGPSKSR